MQYIAFSLTNQVTDIVCVDDNQKYFTTYNAYKAKKILSPRRILRWYLKPYFSVGFKTITRQSIQWTPGYILFIGS